MKPIACLTMNPAVDMWASVKSVAPKEKLRCESPRRDPGGGGINVARAIAALGGEAVSLFTAGGTTGQMLRNLLARDKVEHRAIQIEANSRESFTVLETSSGKEFRFVLPGPRFQEEEWRRCLDHLAGLDPKPEYIVASGSLAPGVPEDFYARVARLANGFGARCVLDTSGSALRGALGDGIYLIKPNLQELEDLVGRNLGSHESQEAASRELVEGGGPEIVALTLGAEGALLTWRGGRLRIASPDVEIRSSVGAGDSFIAGMCLRLAQGWTLEEAFRFGAAAGAAALMTPGTEPCRREDAEALYEKVRAAAAQ